MAVRLALLAHHYRDRLGVGATTTSSGAEARLERWRAAPAGDTDEAPRRRCDAASTTTSTRPRRWRRSTAGRGRSPGRVGRGAARGRPVPLSARSGLRGRSRPTSDSSRRCPVRQGPDAGDVTVRLPDGSTKELADGVDRASTWPRRSARAWPRRRWPPRRRRPRSTSSTAARRRRGGRRHRRQRRPGARCCATRPRTCWPRRCSGCGPAPTTPSARRSRTASTTTSSCPAGRTSATTTSSASTRRCAQIIAEDQPFVREEHSHRRGARRSSPTSPSSARSSRRSRRRRRARHEAPADSAPDARPAISTYRERRRLRRPVPRPARAVDRPPRPLQADPGGRRVLARRREAPPAPAHLRHRLGVRRRRWPSTCTASRRPSGATTALGAELDLFSFPDRDRLGAGRSSTPRAATIRRLMEDYSRERHVEGGYQFVNTPHITKAELFETSGHLQWFADGMYPPMELDGGPALLPQADELPVPHPHLQEPPALLPRAAHAAVRVRHRLPLREVRRRARAHPGAGHDPGRRPHLLHPGADGRASSTSLLTFVLDLLRDFGLDDFYLELSTRPEDKAVGTDEEWDEATEALRAVADGGGPRARDGRGRRRLLRAQDLGPGPRRHRAALAGVDHPARLPDARSASASSTWAPTTPGTARS